ncbi:MAG: HsmA family protein, partial [Clostridium sp.]
MDSKLIFAIVTISLALVFYTVGVFGERKSKTLNKKHLIMFWLGLVFDTTGTITMSRIAAEGTATVSAGAQMLHSVTGVLAIVLMLFHAGWATYVLVKNDDAKKQAFHKFSITV